MPLQVVATLQLLNRTGMNILPAVKFTRELFSRSLLSLKGHGVRLLVFKYLTVFVHKIREDAALFVSEVYFGTLLHTERNLVKKITVKVLEQLNKSSEIKKNT